VSYLCIGPLYSWDQIMKKSVVHWSWLEVLQGQKGWVTGKVSSFRPVVLLLFLFGNNILYFHSVSVTLCFYQIYFAVGLGRFHSCWQFLTRCRWEPVKHITAPFSPPTFPCSIWFVPASAWLRWSSASRQEESSVPSKACSGCDRWWRRR